MRCGGLAANIAKLRAGHIPQIEKAVDPCKGTTETLRDHDWHDLWRLCHGRHSAGLTPTTRDCVRDTAALNFVVADKKARGLFVDRARRREAAFRHIRLKASRQSPP